MRTLEEAIIREREKAEEIRENIIDAENLEPYESYCIAMTERSAEEHEQLAKWLKEYRMLKEKIAFIATRPIEEIYLEAYEKGIADFAERLKTDTSKYDIDDVLGSSDVYSYTNACGIFEDYVDEIAEKVRTREEKEEAYEK